MYNYTAKRSQNFLLQSLPYRYFEATKILIIANVVVYVLTLIIPDLVLILGLYPSLFLKDHYYWQVFSYMFVHDTQSFYHILFNMLALFIFGDHLERKIGSSEFLVMYILAGTATGVLALALGINVIGASAAVFAIMLGFATYYPDARLLVMFVIPMKAYTLVIVYTLISLVFSFIGIQDNIAHWAHLFGLLVGFLYLLVRQRINPIKVFIEQRKRF